MKSAANNTRRNNMMATFAANRNALNALASAFACARDGATAEINNISVAYYDTPEGVELQAGCYSFFGESAWADCAEWLAEAA